MTLLITMTMVMGGCAGSVDKPLVVDDGTIAVTLPAALEIYALDNQKVIAPSRVDGTYTLHITPGKHTLAIQYVVNWNQANDGESAAGRIVRWQPVLVETNFKPDKRYYINYTPPGSYEAALEMKASPEIFLFENNKKIAAGQVTDNPRGLFLFNEPVITQSPTPSGKVREVSQEAPALIELKHWWQQADDAEQQQFLEWINK